VPDEPLLPGGPLPEGYRFRVHLTENLSEDVDLFILDGRLHLAAHYGTLHFTTEGANRIAIQVKVP